MRTREQNLEQIQPDPEELWSRLNQPAVTRLEVLRQVRATGAISSRALKELEKLERQAAASPVEKASPPIAETEMDDVIKASRKLTFDLIIAQQKAR